MDTKTLCLGVLTLGNASGYDIRKQLTETFAHFMEISPSGVYPALKELEQRGHVTAERVLQDDRPNKRIFTITPEGMAAFEAGLAESPGRHKVRSEMLALMFFAEHVPSAHLLEILTGRVSELEAWVKVTEDWLKGSGSTAGTPGQQFISRYALAVMEAEIDFLRRELPDLKATLSRRAAGSPPHRAKRKERAL